MMVIAIGISYYNVALFHLINHAFYKALLFLGAGSVIHAVFDNQDFRKYGGLISYLPLTYSVMLIASLSLVAFPFMTGFYSKDFILESAYGQFSFSGVAVYIIATIGAIFTTLYSVKVLYLTFLAAPNGPRTYYRLFMDLSNPNSYKPAHEGDLFLTFPLVILALFSIFYGFLTKEIFIGLGSNFFVDNSLFIHPIHEIMIDTEFAVPVLFKLLPFMFTISFSIIALTLSELLSELVIYFKLSKFGYNTFGFFNQRFLIEYFYNKYITNLILSLGGQITRNLDKGSTELIGPFGVEKGLVRLSKNISSLSTSHVTTYALYILISIILYLLYRDSPFNLLLLALITLSLVIMSNGESSDSIPADREINYSYKSKKNHITYMYNNNRMFSTSGTLLYADNPEDSGLGTTDNSSVSSGSLISPTSSEDADDMITRPVEDIHDVDLRRYIDDTRDIINHEENDEDREIYIERNRELRTELKRRKDEGVIADSDIPTFPSNTSGSSSESSSNGDEHVPSERSDAPSERSDASEETGSVRPLEETFSGVTSGEDGRSGNATSSIKRPKLEEDEKSSSQPSTSKRFKQDSSDVTGDTEPFDFGGGDD